MFSSCTALSASASFSRASPSSAPANWPASAFSAFEIATRAASRADSGAGGVDAQAPTSMRMPARPAVISGRSARPTPVVSFISVHSLWLRFTILGNSNAAEVRRGRIGLPRSRGTRAGLPAGQPHPAGTRAGWPRLNSPGLECRCPDEQAQKPSAEHDTGDSGRDIQGESPAIPDPDERACRPTEERAGDNPRDETHVLYLRASTDCRDGRRRQGRRRCGDAPSFGYTGCVSYVCYRTDACALTSAGFC